MPDAGDAPYDTRSMSLPTGHEEDKTIKWHALHDVQEVFDQLNVSDKGLTTAQAETRIHEYGYNRLTPPKKVPLWKKIWDQINNILIYILLVAAAFSIYFAVSSDDSLDAWIEFGLIIGVIVINVLIGLIQEGKAEKAAEAIKAMLSAKATVLRDGEKISIDADLLVPGDIIYLKSGDRVPADARMIYVNKLQVQESMLTGESDPVSKNMLPVDAKLGIGDRKCMVYSATMCTTGEGTAVVCETGDSAEIGRISQLVSSVEKTKTNLLVQLEILGIWIAVFVVVIAIGAFFLGMFGPFKDIWEDEGKTVWEQAFKNAVAIAVAMIPEGLPAVVTITLALGVTAMARQNAIIRQLPCVETLGSLTVICSDKTGTLTKNEMTVVAVRSAKSHFDVTGIGYAPKGDFVDKDKVPVGESQRAFIKGMLEVGTLCNNSSLVQTTDVTGGEKWEAAGNPTEAAILAAGRKAGIDTKALYEDKPLKGSIPFESDHKFMATVNENNGVLTMNVKGAADRLIDICKDQVADDDMKKRAPIDKEYWQQAASELSSRGLRVLALCITRVPNGFDMESLEPAYIYKKEVTLTMVGLVAILDPPREECIPSINEAHTAGIEVKMITGDHAQTALAIAKMLNIVDKTNEHIVYTGPQLDEMTRPELEDAVMKCNVFARSSPENKIQIVQALQARHQVSSMTGDGVNDAPALKAANIGVAMGITGTDVSKEASQMVLADDNFATIIAAVREGRRVWDNLRKILIFNLPVNLAQGLSVFIALAFSGLGDVPLTAIQVLYVNMITSVTMGLMLAAEPAEETIMERPPRRPNKRLLGKLVLWKCLFVSVQMVAAVIGVFKWAQIWPDGGYSIEKSRGEAFTVLIFMEIAYSFTTRFLKQSAFRKETLTGNKWAYVSIAIVAGLQFLILYVPGLNDTVFDIQGINGWQWLRVIIISVILFFVVEIEKALVDPLLFPMVKPFLKKLGLVTPRYEGLRSRYSEASDTKDPDVAKGVNGNSEPKL